MKLRYAYARIRTMFMSPMHAGAWAKNHGLNPTRVAYGKGVADRQDSHRAAVKRMTTQSRSYNTVPEMRGTARTKGTFNGPTARDTEDALRLAAFLAETADAVRLAEDAAAEEMRKER